MVSDPEKMPSSMGSDTIATSSRPSSKHESDNTSAITDPDIENGIPVVNTTDVAVEEKSAGIERVVSVTSGNIVTWNDDADPRRPINWTNKRKWINCSIISVLTFLTPLASSMAAPAVPLIMEHFKSTDSTLGSFIVSIVSLPHYSRNIH